MTNVPCRRGIRPFKIYPSLTITRYKGWLINEKRLQNRRFSIGFIDGQMAVNSCFTGRASQIQRGHSKTGERWQNRECREDSDSIPRFRAGKKVFYQVQDVVEFLKRETCKWGPPDRWNKMKSGTAELLAEKQTDAVMLQFEQNFCGTAMIKTG